MGNLSPGELAILLLIALLVFGGKGLPQAGKALGNGLRELRRALGEAQGALRDLDAGSPRPRSDTPAQANLSPRRLVD